MEFTNGLRKVILDLKIYYTLNFIYPGKNAFKRIKSILPNTIVVVEEDVVVEEKVDFGTYLTELKKGVFIGKNTYIGYCNFIGRYTSISSDVKIGLIAHPTDFISTSPVFYAKRRGWVKNNLFHEDKKGFTKIGNDVLISANTMVLAGVNIGNGAIIGAGSFVNKDVPPYAIVAGIPAKIIRSRFNEEQITILQNTQWWNLSKEELLKFENDFSNIDGFIEILKTKC